MTDINKMLFEIEEYGNRGRDHRQRRDRRARRRNIQFNKLYNESELEGDDDKMMNVNIKVNAEPVFEIKDIKFEVVTLNGVNYITTNQISTLIDKQLSKTNKAVHEIIDVLVENGVDKLEMTKYFIEFHSNTDEEHRINYYVSSIGFALLSPAIMNNGNNNLMMKLAIMEELTK